jgi:signal transduction histidine kinase
VAGAETDLSRSRHRTLARHLRKAGIDPDVGPTSPEQWARLHERLEQSFKAIDRERYMIERSIELSSREMEALHDQLRADRERLAAVMEALPQAVAWLDSEFVVEDGNRAAWQLFGGGHDGGRVDEAITLYHADGPYVFPHVVEALGSGVSESDGAVLVDGAYRLASWSLLPLVQQHGAVLVVNDLTALKRQEEAAREAQREAKESNEHRASRGRFLANMSHELRTPLNAILGYTELLQEDVDSPDLDRIHRSGTHLLALINDLLDLSKIDAGKMPYHLETVDPGEVAQEVVELLTPRAREQRTVLTVAPSSVVCRADRHRLAQCLLNLVGNAIKFTADGRVAIAVQPLDDVVCIEVRDTGTGIAPEDLERIFRPFAQADDVRGRGTGLGLPLTRALAQGMGGELLAESTPGVGSVFRLRLPQGSRRGAEVA